MSSSTDDFILTDNLLKETIKKKDGRKFDFYNGLVSGSLRNCGLGGLDRGNLKKLKDHHVMDFLTNHVNADLVTSISLTDCSGITNDTLIQISNMCPHLEELHVNECDMITDNGIIALAEKCGQQLKTLN
jgi:hypothetical protein